MTDAGIEQSVIDLVFGNKPAEKTYCKQNRWMSFDCVLCKVILPSFGSYQNHCQTELHQRHVKMETANKVHTKLPVVFHSVFEHNSNLLGWRETGAIMEIIPMTSDGDFDYDYLE